MTSESLVLKNVGPIREANVRFGELTVLVGPQATGKSILLQFLKLLLDAGRVFDKLRRYGMDWDDYGGLFDLYFGEGMRSIWSDSSGVVRRGKKVDIPSLTTRLPRQSLERCAFIPAQRSLCFSPAGWFRPFESYNDGDPYVVREFSDTLRARKAAINFRGMPVDPLPEQVVRPEILKLLAETIFGRFRLEIESGKKQRRFVLGQRRGPSLPFMVWSTGQREVVPLLLGIARLTPGGGERHESIDWVVIEEPEAGLHPKAITAVLALVLDLLFRGYHVCLSTHSPHVLDLVWALRIFRQYRADASSVLRVLDVDETPGMRAVAASVLKKTTKVYYFDPKTRSTVDISDLDPSSKQAPEAVWGGLAEFSGRAADEVANVVASRKAG